MPRFCATTKTSRSCTWPTGSNQFGRRAVEIGESQNGQTQILKGLSAGDKVVGDGSLFLQFANSFQH